MGEENFLKKAFLPPNPHLSKTLKRGGIFFAIIPALNGRTAYVRTIPRAKVFSQVFFKKLAGLGGAHKKTAFLFAKLFLCASCAKEKAEYGVSICLRRGKLSWEESFSPHPFQRTLDGELIFLP